MLGLASAPEPLVSLVHRETSGNPFFIEEAVRSLMEDGTISRLGLSFRADVDALTSISFPMGVGDAIRRRLSGLDPGERRVVEALSVIGRPADRDLVLAASGLGGAELDEALATLEARQVIHEGRGGARTTWVLASARVREHLYDGIEWDRRRELHTAIGATLKARADAGEPVRLEELARHFINGGDPSSGLAYALEAARHSRGVGAGAEAVAFYRRALELLPAEAHAERAGILRDLGIIERELGRDAKALESFEQSLRAAMQGSRRDLGALARLEKASSLLARARPEEAVREVERAMELQAPDGDATLMARGQSILSGVLARTGKMERALEVQERALDTARRGGSPRSVAASLNNLANLHFLAGRHAEAIGHLERSLEIRREIGDRHGELEASSNLGLFLVDAGRLDEAIPVLDGCATIARAIGDLPALVESRINLGGAHTAGGRYDQALRSFEEAAAVAIRIGDDARASNALDGWGTALRIIGDTEGAAERHTQALERARRAEDPAQETFALASLAIDRAATGDPDAAREAVRRAARSAPGEISPRARARILEATALAHLVAGAPGDAERAALEMIDSARTGSLAHEGAEAYGLLGLARGALGDIEAATAALDQAVALSSGGRFEEIRWRALASLASLKGVDAARSRGARREAATIVRDLASSMTDEEIRGRYLSRPDRAALLATVGDIGVERSGAGGVARGALSAIYRMAELVTSITDVDEMLAHVLDLALEIVHAERGLVILVDGDRQEVRAARGVEPETVADALEYSRSVVRETAQGRTLITIDAEGDARTHRYKSVSLFRIKSLACVPMKVGGRIIGTVYLDSRSLGTAFHDEEIDFLKAFANLAAAALEMSRLNSQLSSENVSLHREVQDLRKAAGRRTGYQNIIGRTVRMQAVYDLLEKVSASTLPVLITGESGTGKELVARAIHFTGPRKERKFLSENVAAIPGTLLESELFGHVRGTFTGADRDRKGVFELADGGSLFLDEIGDMSLPLQSKLLRALQEGEIRPVGGKDSVKVDVRIISATNRDLEGMMREGSFREDLYYRLNVVRINIPPLRERKEDIPLLVEHFLDRAAEANSGQRKRMDISALQLLLRYDWPGNVRELENEILKLSVLTERAAITQQDLAQHRDLFDRLTRLDAATSEFQSLIEMEKKQIERALVEAGGNRARAAALLGISRATIYRKLREHDISA
jgi:Nif-specific regulatory protein